MSSTARSARPGPPAPSADRTETAIYIAALTRDLARIAGRSGMPTLAYLLDMARLEAELHAKDAGARLTEPNDDASKPGGGLT